MQHVHTYVGVFLLILVLLSPFHVSHAGLLTGREVLVKEKESAKETDPDTWLLSYYVGYHNEYLKPRDIDYSLMTHIVVGGVGVRPDGTLHEHWHLTNGKGREMALDVGQRAKREGVKTLVWLGGPNEEDYFYSASSDANREVFVENIITLLDELNYDGVDIDWEPIRKKDESRLLALVRDLREADPGMIITVPVNWVPSSILFTKDLSLYQDLSSYVDRFFIMSYSMAGPWPGWESWHGGALNGDGRYYPSSIKSSTYAYQKAGVPEEKIGIGIGTYATCWEYPVRRPEQVLPVGYYSNRVHTMSMRTLMDEYYSKSREVWDKKAVVPYLSYSRPTGDLSCGYISYENERSIEKKVSYAKRANLGGVMVWNIGTGYYPDEQLRKRHALLQAAYQALFE